MTEEGVRGVADAEAGAGRGGHGGRTELDGFDGFEGFRGHGGRDAASSPAPSSAPSPFPSPSPARPGSDGEHTLQQHLGSADRANRFYDEQVLDHLNPRMQEFVRQQEMFFLSTADRDGECDSSFRAGPPGFLRVLDERTLVYPEYRGNGVHASLGNISENPHVGLLLVDFVRARIGLHVNGGAAVVEDAELRAEVSDLPEDPVPGRRGTLWVRVTVEEAYIHCAKHIPHLQKAPKRTAREWGTDDYKRKGGDFFGAAREAKERRQQAGQHTAEHPATPPDPAPAPAPTPGPMPASLSSTVSLWQQEAERALAEARRRGEELRERERERAPFQGWFG